MDLRYGLFALLSFWSTGFSQLSPGDLHQSHAQLEGLKNCSECHGIGQKIAADNCLKCHRVLKERIDENIGLHSNAAYRECEKCHVEHHGRDFDLIYWENGQENFNHQLTGFVLEGKHAQLKCRDCHQAKHIIQIETITRAKKNPDKTFLGLVSRCNTCHFDEHRGQLSLFCQNCHTFQKWKPAEFFTHSNTRYPLTGKHTLVSCVKCHFPLTDGQADNDKTYLKMTGLTYNNCSGCHNDIHKNKFGQNCAKCHNTTGWTNYESDSFDHSMTRYPLNGKHREVTCKKCHLPGKSLASLRFNRCLDCHDDYHKGQFTHRPTQGDCQECHTVYGYKPVLFTIEKHNQISFKLEGGHLATPCNRCHYKLKEGTSFELVKFSFPSTNCIDCHSDPHKGSVTKYMDEVGCSGCHDVQSWQVITFDHSRTGFPLELKHAKAPCQSCHKKSSENFILFTHTAKNCENCHQDPHYNQFATSSGGNKKSQTCEKCHTPRDWKAERFNHDIHALFKLEGAHERISCNKCHPTETKSNITFVRYKPIPSNCIDCHGKSLKQEKIGDAKIN
ncbi:MAG: cytochrome C [bacterium]|nr:MAG: cytochrome C [bacterium]